MDLLELLALESKALPGHGRMKEVPATVSQFRLEATVMWALAAAPWDHSALLACRVTLPCSGVMI